ncbi:MAG: 4a-hydroxytetrahydrobiopterin dehydratase [Deltaproteobacteria bacterium]|nr:4a-hydroxytetrahydrobiopterin dehydratase [Deltaproteobacteria bacterium]MBN2670263.1 4a-hydroxytetrahydrobiopterin dehydratase [Deltaproteobacteria bacterium]
MNNRAKKTCRACSPDAPRAPRLERQQFQKEHVNWQFVNENDIEKIRRTFFFDQYSEAIDFTNEIAELADFEDHHPTILLEWGKVTVTWWTHKIGGVHINDLLMARETDDLFASRIL